MVSESSLKVIKGGVILISLTIIFFLLGFLLTIPGPFPSTVDVKKTYQECLDHYDYGWCTGYNNVTAQFCLGVTGLSLCPGTFLHNPNVVNLSDTLDTAILIGFCVVIAVTAIVIVTHVGISVSINHPAVRLNLFFAATISFIIGYHLGYLWVRGTFELYGLGQHYSRTDPCYLLILLIVPLIATIVYSRKLGCAFRANRIEYIKEAGIWCPYEVTRKEEAGSGV